RSRRSTGCATSRPAAETVIHLGVDPSRDGSTASDGKVIRWEVAETDVAAQRFYQRIGAGLVSKSRAAGEP
ncbi:hypothetical protein ACWEPL_64255, partial [Nonomuraea sp. NPDC004186]